MEEILTATWSSKPCHVTPGKLSSLLCKYILLPTCFGCQIKLDETKWGGCAISFVKCLLDKSNTVNLNEIKVCQTKDLIFSLFKIKDSFLHLGLALKYLYSSCISQPVRQGQRPSQLFARLDFPLHDYFKGPVYVNLLPGCYSRGFYYIILCWFILSPLLGISGF